MKKNLMTMATVAMAMTIASCSTSKNAQVSGKEKTGNEVIINNSQMDENYLILTDTQRQIVEKNNDFALRLFQEVSGFESRVISPMSVSYLMGMLANAADGNTREEIMKTIGCEDISVKELNEFYLAMMNQANPGDKSTALKIANYIALNDRFSLKKPFENDMKNFYHSGVESLDFSSSSATKHINEWCKKNTDGMIPSIIDQVEPSAVSYLMNAIYFNGTWAEKFDKKDTKTENFRGYTRDIKKVPMMHRNDEYYYMNNDMYAAISLPYSNRKYTMTVLLPNEDKSIPEMMKDFKVEDLRKLNRNMEKCIVDLKLPRFTTELNLTLNDIIGKLGAPSMFTSTANFSHFADGSLSISKMLQKAKIEVSEEGTKAAAVTAAIMTMSALQPEPRHVVFHANRPFVYMITDNTTGAIFFMGLYTGSGE